MTSRERITVCTGNDLDLRLAEALGNKLVSRVDLALLISAYVELMAGVGMGS